MIAYAIPPLWMIFAGVYLLVGVPIVFVLSVSLAFFALFIAPGRHRVRSTCLGMLMFSLAHIALAYFFIDGATVSPSSPFEYFWLVALLASPCFFLFAALLPSRGIVGADLH